MKGEGLEAIRERIRQSFLKVHNDERTREDVARGDASKRQADAYIRAALRSPHVAMQANHGRDVPCYVIEEPVESADAVIAQAVRYLERRDG